MISSILALKLRRGADDLKTRKYVLGKWIFLALIVEISQVPADATPRSSDTDRYTER